MISGIYNMNQLILVLRRLDIVLLFTLRRIYLGGFALIGVRELLYTLAGVVIAVTSKRTRGLNVAIWSLSFGTIFGFGMTGSWGGSLELLEGLENLYFFAALTTLCFVSVTVRNAAVDFDAALVCAISYVFFRHFVLGDRSGGFYLGYYGWPNSTWLAPTLVSYGIYKFYKIEKSKLPAIFMSVIAAAVLIADSQRGGFVNLFLVATLIVFILRRQVLFQLAKTTFLVGWLAALSYLMLIHDERSTGGFFLSIVRPFDYIDQYSSGASRINQIWSALEIWTQSLETVLIGVGPFEIIIQEKWNDVHMGYVSFLARYGLIAFFLLTVCLWRSFIFCTSAIREGRARSVHFLFLTLVADALTQTTFDSVPTAAITILVLAYCSQDMFFRNRVVNVSTSVGPKPTA